MEKIFRIVRNYYATPYGRRKARGYYQKRLEKESTENLGKVYIIPYTINQIFQ
jgi:hypothetical protein